MDSTNSPATVIATHSLIHSTAFVPQAEHGLPLESATVLSALHLGIVSRVRLFGDGVLCQTVW